MHAHAKVLERFEQLGTKHAFRSKDGRHWLGWVDEVREATIVFWPAPSPFDPDAPATLELLIDDLDLESLAYWDDEKRAWVSWTA